MTTIDETHGLVFEIATIADIDSQLLPMMKDYYMEDGNKEMDWEFSRRAVLSLTRMDHSLNKNVDVDVGVGDDEDEDDVPTLDGVYGSIWFLKVKQQQNGDDEYAGYVCLSYSFSLEYGGLDAMIDELYVRRQYRRKGFGTCALKFVQSVCHKRQINALHLEVLAGNTVIDLYKRHGFEEHDSFFMSKWI